MKKYAIIILMLVVISFSASGNKETESLSQDGSSGSSKSDNLENNE